MAQHLLRELDSLLGIIYQHHQTPWRLRSGLGSQPRDASQIPSKHMQSITEPNLTNTGPFRIKLLNLTISSVSLSVLIVCSISLLVLCGWLFEIDFLKRIVPGYVLMNPTTAVVLISLSLALWLSESRHAAIVHVIKVLAGVPVLAGLLKLSAMAGLFDLGIDHLLFSQQFDTITGRQNEMSPQTAVNLILLGVAILLFNTKSKRLREIFPAQYLAMAAFLSSSLAIIGYLYGTKSFYILVNFSPMAIHTAVAFLVLSIGVLLSKPNRGIIKELLSDNPGGKMARSLMPVVILVPAALGWLRLFGEGRGYYEGEMGASMLVVAIIIILGVVVLSNARTMNIATVSRIEIEDSLNEATRRERAIIQNALDIICTVDANGNFTTISPACFKVWGYRPEELIGKPFIAFVMTEDVAKTNEIALEIMSGVEARGFENRYVHKNGSLVDMNWTAYWSDSDQLMFSIAHDVTQRKKAHESLRQNESKFRELLEAAPDAMVVVNAKGDIVLLNVQAEKQFGYSRDELVGQKVTNIIPEGFAERLVADELRSDADALDQQIGSGIELTALRKNGSEFPIEIMLSPLESTEGILVMAAIRDISARRAADSHLVQMEGRYRGLLEAAPDAMVVVNAKGDIVLLNVQAEKQFGYSRDELVGQKLTSIIPEGFAERLVADDLRSAPEALAQQIGMGIELSALRKDGSEFPIEIMLSPLDSAEGILVTAAIRDISARRAADSHLVQMEGRYRGLLEAAPDAMVVVNAKGDIVLLNVQAEKQFGYRRDELVGQKVTNIIPEGFAERLVADDLRSASDALAQQIGMGIELSARRKDGSEFPIEIMLSPLDSAEGILVTAAIRDISSRKKAERYLARMEGRYRGLMEAAPDAMVVVNEFGAIVLVNVQAEKQFGYSRNELIGQQMTSLIPEGFAERLVADDLRTAAEALAQQIGTGIELSALRKDGTEFPIEIMLSPLDSEEGILVTAAIRDISVRRAADLQVVQMEGRYRGLLEAAPDAMVVVNSDGDIVLVNVQAEKQFGYLRDELVGQKVTSIIPEGFAERLVADALRSDEDALAQKIGTGIELVALRNDGTEFPIELMLSPLASDDGILVTAAIRDITGRKLDQLNLLNKVDELKRSNEELDQFASVASHDLQEPLRMVASYTQLLSRRYKGRLDDEADEFIAFAVDGADRMQGLIKDLLDYSRVGTKGKELQPTSSEQAFQKGLLNLRGAIKDSNALVTSDLLPDVMADEPQLIQLFQNLIGNGIKYQRAGEVPLIHVSAKQKNKNWVFSVTDNGLGIEPIYFGRIFGMFQRLHRRDEFAGTGIGLAICKKIVERHGGNITVESEPGQGSTFQFELSGSATDALISRPVYEPDNVG